jgi:hypothetical protein
MAHDRAPLDAILKLADKALAELQALLDLFDRAGTVKRLRDIADRFDRLPHLENDISLLRARLRTMMSTDPDRTPVTGISSEMAAVRDKSRDFTKPGGITPAPEAIRVLPRPIARVDPKEPGKT